MYYTDFGSIPREHYSVVYADPPWAYGDKMTGHSFSLDHEYATQSPRWIQQLPVRSITTPSTALFLWVPSPQLPIGLETMKAWGFTFKTVAFVWSKRTPHGKEVANLGRWTMGNVEMCLLGTRGQPQRVVRNVKQLIVAARGRHSAKPAEAAERIERLFGPCQRIELFARTERSGWDQFGNEPPLSESSNSQSSSSRDTSGSTEQA